MQNINELEKRAVKAGDRAADLFANAVGSWRLLLFSR